MFFRGQGVNTPMHTMNYDLGLFKLLFCRMNEISFKKAIMASQRVIKDFYRH